MSSASPSDGYFDLSEVGPSLTIEGLMRSKGIDLVAPHDEQMEQLNKALRGDVRSAQRSGVGSTIEKQSAVAAKTWVQGYVEGMRRFEESEANRVARASSGKTYKPYTTVKWNKDGK